VVVVEHLVDFDVADAFEISPAVQVKGDPFEADVVEDGHYASRDQNLPAGGVIVETRRVVDAFADEVVWRGGIDLRHADVHADPYFHLAAAGRFDGIISVALLDLRCPGRGMNRVVKHEEVPVSGG
jgi:hypothetical protein